MDELDVQVDQKVDDKAVVVVDVLAANAAKMMEVAQVELE